LPLGYNSELDAVTIISSPPSPSKSRVIVFGNKEV